MVKVGAEFPVSLFGGKSLLGSKLDWGYIRDENFKDIFERDKERLDEIRRNKGFIPIFDDKIKYIGIDYTLSIDLAAIRDKFKRGYIGENKHLIIVLFGPNTLKSKFQADLNRILAYIPKYAAKYANGFANVHIITLEQYVEYFDIDTINTYSYTDKTGKVHIGIDAINTYVAEAIDNPSIMTQLQVDSTDCRARWKKILLGLNHINPDRLLKKN
ncbi:MAG: hypothetical protein BAJALOKI1v1_750021 [Promethearchaeota archaeon]|nr:MAG: hypothetical protein BAJALOKI1v1_750021 [Candidatus Lokiarchaeota archaeon]